MSENKFIFTREIPSAEAMHEFGCKWAKCMPPQGIIFFQGQLGAGKTTLIRGFLAGLGYQGKVKSPTYTIVETYELPGVLLHHFDFYRLSDPNELMAIGLSEYMTPNSLCLAEWPEKVASALPAPDLLCTLDFTPAGRLLTLEAISSLGKEVWPQIRG